MTTVTEILELYRYVGDTEAAETALTELITESYSDGYSFAKNEAGLDRRSINRTSSRLIMNIFFLDKRPDDCAEMHCDKHCVKMILEYCTDVINCS